MNPQSAFPARPPGGPNPHLKKVLLIFPREKGIKFSNDALYPFPILGLTLLASLFPQTYEVKIVNEAIEKVDFNADPIRFAPPALAPSSQVEIEMSIAVAFR